MSKARKRLALVGACAVVAVLAGPGLSSASAMTVFVSNTAPVAAVSGDCEHPSYTTIQGAVEAVSPGTTIEVCPGTYAEQLVIDKRVKINAFGGEGSATVKLPATIATASGPCATSPEEETEIVLCTSESVNLTNLRIDARFPTGTCRQSLYGIFVGGGATLIARYDQIVGAGASPVNGCLGAVGLQVGFTPPPGQGGRVNPEQVGRAKLIASSIREYDASGIVAEGAGSNVAVIKSDIHGGGPSTSHNPTGIQIRDGASGSVKGSWIQGNANAGRQFGTGILIHHAAPPVVISNDTLEENGIGLRFASGAATQPSSPEVKVVHNHFINDEYAGLFLEQGDALINYNSIEGGQLGILINQTASQPFAPNSSALRDTVSGTGEVAIEVQSDNSPGDHPGDFLIKNSAISNNPVEVRDQSTTFTVTRFHDT
jgi:hypothetical protein